MMNSWQLSEQFEADMSGSRIEDYGPCFYLTTKRKGKEKTGQVFMVEEEAVVEELKPIESQPVEELLNGLVVADDVVKTTENGPPSREDSEPEIYTSFLTIDVTKFAGAELKPRDTLGDLFSGSRDSVYSDEVDGENFKQRKSDLNMITKYLNSFPLDPSHWPQNYDVVRDLAKVYLTAKNCGDEFLSALLDYFVKLKWPHVFTRCLSRMAEAFPQVFLHSFDRKINFEDPTPEVIDLRVHSLEYAVAVLFHLFLLIALEITETHVASVDACCEGGLIRFIFKDLFPKMHGISWGKHTAREEFLSAAMDIVYNCARSSKSGQHYLENGAIESLVQFRKETEYISANRINISSLLALTFLIDDKTNHLIITDPAPLSVLFLCLNECFSSDDRCYGDFTSKELLNGLTRIVSHDVNKIMFCELGSLGDLSKVFEEIRSEDECIAACRLLWSLCLLPKCRQVVRRRCSGILNVLRSLQHSKSDAVQHFVRMVLWEIVDKFESTSTSVAMLSGHADGHVYVSAQSADEGLAGRIRYHLALKGYRVWEETDDNENGGDCHMADIVRRASAVVVCVGRKYKQEPECFAAADYAFQTRKPIVPIITERSYRPDGWLGPLVASKPWLDFSLPSKFDAGLTLLVRQLGEKGRGAAGMNGAGAGRHNDCAQNGYLGRDQGMGHDVTYWDNRQVVDWLTSVKLISGVKEEKVGKLRGVHLIRLNELRKESPDFYYTALEPQLGFSDVLDMLEFTEALERLIEGR